jgi:thymidylate synthase
MLKNVLHLNKHKDRDPTKAFHEEYQYLNLLNDIIKDGSMETGRNGNVKTIIGSAMHFSLEDGHIPIFTTKKTAWKTCLKELIWFVRGETDNQLLTKQNVHIWDGNTTQDFLDSRGLSHYREGRDIGPMYGFNWRYWGAQYTGCETDYTGKGIDQLQTVIDCLKDPKQRSSRRMIISAWNTSVIDQGVLPPCHTLMQFNVIDGNKLSCSLYARSQDEPLGTPFNIASYSFLTFLLAKHCDLIPYEFIIHGGNCHIYEEHLDSMTEQVTRDPYEFPKLTITTKKDNINEYTIEDFELKNYQSHPPIKMKMVA